MFNNESWVHDTIHELQTNDVVQMFQTACDLGRTDQFAQNVLGLAWRIHKDFGGVVACGGGGRSLPVCDVTERSHKDAYHYVNHISGHPGYAWACTRRAWDQMGGLLETAILGSADRHMAFAWFQVADRSLHADLNPIYRATVMAYQERCAPFIARVGYVNGNINHYFHGRKANRRYDSRWRILLDHNYNPLADVRKNAFGVLEFNSTKPMLSAAVMAYFKLRDEDSPEE
jgi:hypothetical protein